MTSQSVERERVRHEQGFTLVELLVVVIVIGILAGIAVPGYLNQRKKAVDGTLKSDIRHAAVIAEDLVAEPIRTMQTASWNPVGPRVTAFDLFYVKDLKASRGNVLRIAGNPVAGTFRICAFNPAAGAYSTEATALIYDNQQGGIQTAAGDCTFDATPWYARPWQSITSSPYGTPAPQPWS